MKNRVILGAVLSVCLSVLTYTAFCLVSENDFVRFDDHLYITENPHVLAGLSWDSIKWAFQTTETGNWIPLTWLSHMADVQFLGLNPGRHHLVNLGFHTLSSVLIFLLLYRTTRRPWASFLAALLFAVHPLRVESVAWASERKDTLSTFLGLLSLWSYVLYAGRKNKFQYCLCLFFLILGLMSKAMLVTWPFVFLLMDYWPLRRFQTEGLQSGRFPVVLRQRFGLLLAEKIPFFVVISIFSVISYYAQKTSSAVVSSDVIPILYRFENAVISYVTYLWLMVYPKSLAVYYPMFPEAITHAKALSCLGVISAVTAIVFWKRQQKPYLLMGWLWYLGTLIPVIGFVKIGGQALADRYTYIPSIGISIMIGFALADLASRGSKIKIAVTAGVIPVIAGLIIMTWFQTSYWQNNRTLFSHALKVTVKNYKMHVLYGTVLLQSREFDDAIAQFERAHELIPSVAAPVIQMAKTQMEMNNYQQAIRLLHQASGKKDADPAEIAFLLGTCNYNLGRPDEAIADLTKALEIKQNRIEALTLMAQIYTEKGGYDKALNCYEQGLDRKPQSLLLLNRLTLFYTDKDNPFYEPAKALEYSQRACILSEFRYREPIMMTLQILEEHKELEKTLNPDFLSRLNRKLAELKENR